MGLAPSQPNVEFFSTECYGGPKQYNQFPDGEKTHAFSLIAELFAPQSRGSVTLKSANPRDNPVVQHNYLSEELDVLVLSEACKFANEIITKGKGTKEITEGSWPSELTHHQNITREDWVPFVKENATTCKSAVGVQYGDSAVTDIPQAITQEALAKWAQMTTQWQSWTHN
jgi:choline dehydrogenase-like flavoprotein